MRHIIVKEYLESLKEDKELDYIFPMLLESMGYEIVSTPKHSKGQTQYGKDIVAIGKDSDGKTWKWYFELKGNAAKDITDKNFNIKDGVRESLLEAKDVDFESFSIHNFNELPTKYVFVHNGIMSENIRIQFESFIKKNFEDGTFERWGIEKLENLFSEYLFDECLFSDDDTYRLMKRTLVLLDAPSNDFHSFKEFVNITLRTDICKGDFRKRMVHKMFTSLNLASLLIYKYSQEYDNLYPAKYCVNYALLQSWGYILEKKWFDNKIVLSYFERLLNLQIQIYTEYINKTYSLACVQKGLYSFGKSDTEPVCYPLRCFDYLNDLLYFAMCSTFHCSSGDSKILRRKHIDAIKKLITANSGFDMMLLDTHSISILYLYYYILSGEQTEDDVTFLYEYLIRLVQNIIIRYKKQKMLPEIYGNRIALAKSIYEKSDEYNDQSSIALLNILEIISYFNCQDSYNELRKVIVDSKVNLQISYPDINLDVETLLFKKKLYAELAVETSIILPETLDEFKKTFKKKCHHVNFITDRKLPYLKVLAHIFYDTDIFPTDISWGYVKYID